MPVASTWARRAAPAPRRPHAANAQNWQHWHLSTLATHTAVYYMLLVWCRHEHARIYSQISSIVFVSSVTCIYILFPSNTVSLDGRGTA